MLSALWNKSKLVDRIDMCSWQQGMPRPPYSGLRVAIEDSGFCRSVLFGL